MSELYTKFGELLRLERERQGIKLTDISNELKIPEDTLGQIEAGDIEALPSDLYFKLFSRSFAEYLGIDFGKTLEAIKEEIGDALEPNGPDEPQPRDTGETSDSVGGEAPDEGAGPGANGTVRRLVILGGIVVGAFIIFLVAFQMFFAGDASERDLVTTDSDEAVSSTGESPAPSAAESYNWDVPVYQPPDSILLTLTARLESWATVLADGDTVLYQILTPDRRYALRAKYRFLVSVGVPRVVDIAVDDRPAYLANAETGRISRVEIDQTNRDQFQTRSQPPVTAAAASERTPEVRSETIDTAQSTGPGNL